MNKIVKTLIISFLLSFLLNPMKINAQDLQKEELRNKYKKSLKFDTWPNKNNLVRDGINLSSYKFYGFPQAQEIKRKNNFYVFVADNKDKFIQSVNSWKIGENDFLDIIITYFDSGIKAQEFVIDHYFINSTMPDSAKIKIIDQTPIVGDISFLGGQIFIKNNIIVEIDARGQFKPDIIQIANEINDLLSNKKIFLSSEKIKPRVEKDDSGDVKIVKPDN